MHIPDGFLDTKTWITLSVVSGGAIGYAVKKTKKIADEKHIPLLGVMAAFIFAAQMVNFPVAGGTSGHFMGGALAAILLGPFSGILVMTTLLSVQCLVFQDGGITALGANIFNMGILGTFASYFIYAVLNRGWGRMGHYRLVVAGIAAWFSIVLASAACAVELGISGTVPLRIVMPAMVGVHSLIGIVEALITGLIISFISKARPDLLELEKV
jgi:cobalt/nickel transport system permease protein